jgi:cardiolipin synthase A/B
MVRAVEWRRVVIAPVFAALASVWACSSAELKGPVPTGNQAGGSSGDPATEDPDGGFLADGAPKQDAEVEPPAATPGVTIQVQPSDNGLALVNAIKGAKKSLHMEMYLLSSDEIVDALIDLKKAGKDVKVILNKTFPPNGGDNTSVYTTLKNYNVDVVWAPAGYQFTHAKTILIDGTKLIVMTMNLTFTSAQTNREYIATDTDPTDVADAEKIFDADYKDESVYLASTRLVLSPDTASSVNAQTRLVNLVASAKKSLDVEVQSLSDDKLVEAIVKAKGAGVAVRVVLDGDTLGGTAQEQAVADLKSGGVAVKVVSNPDIHAKAIVVDGARAFVGSQNMTSTALFANREMGIITDATAEVAKVTKAITDDYAKGTTP